MKKLILNDQKLKRCNSKSSFLKTVQKYVYGTTLTQNVVTGYKITQKQHYKSLFIKNYSKIVF